MLTDPVGSILDIKENFLLYIKTAFGTQYPQLDQERISKLNEPGAVAQDPWIEPRARYVDCGKSITQLTQEDLPSLNAHTISQFTTLARLGLVEDYPLYEHQLQMLQHVLSGRNAVVTAGTGSGKTEAFLLPLFAQLVAEMQNWDTVHNAPAHHSDWWKTGQDARAQQLLAQGQSPRVAQRSDNRAAVRALILYPMNALVEDQLTRLRKALDSDGTRQWLDSPNGGCGQQIYFGRYNSETPVPGRELTRQNRADQARIQKLIEKLRETENSSDRAIQMAISGGAPPEARYFFPRLDGAEMRSRWDMQSHPPDILITNYSMLSIMLMREADAPIFDQTARWLRDNPDSKFHLIVDELHLYRGTAGTEVAYLLRLLLHRLGLTPDDPRLRILASSASLEKDDPRSIEFLNDFFGCKFTADDIIPGRERINQRPAEVHFPSAQLLCNLADAMDDNNESSVSGALASIISEQRGNSQPTGNLLQELHAIWHKKRFDNLILNSFVDETGKTEAINLLELGRKIFGEELPAQTARNAARGLFIARGAIECSEDCTEKLAAYRFHVFFRNIEGLWACPVRDCPETHDLLDQRPCGNLSIRNKNILCENSTEPHRLLELLYCEHCGTLFFGGRRLTLQDGGGWEILKCDPDLDSVPDKQAARFVEQRHYQEHIVFWPEQQLQLHESLRNGATFPQAIIRQRRAPGATGSWVQAALAPRTATVHPGRPNTDDEIPGFLFSVFTSPSITADQVLGIPSTCPSCAEDYFDKVRRRSPVRSFRSGFFKVAQLLTKELFYQLPDTSNKLVLFSDSREDAASTSYGMEAFHYSDLVREIIYDELSLEALGKPSLLLEIEANAPERSLISERFVRRYPNAPTEVSQHLARANRPLPTGLDEQDLQDLRLRYDQSRAFVTELRSRAQTRTVSLRALFEDSPNRALAPVISRLKHIGVNPSGLERAFQRYDWGGAENHWSEFFDWNPVSGQSFSWVAQQDEGGAALERENRFRRKVISEICEVIFGRLYFGFESAGLGYLSHDLDQQTIADAASRARLTSDIVIEILNASLRILGDLWRWPKFPSQWDQPDWRNPQKRLEDYLSRLETTLPTSTNLTGAISDLLRRSHAGFRLNPREINVRVAIDEDPVWICERCRRPHLHRSGGICTNCLNPLAGGRYA